MSREVTSSSPPPLPPPFHHPSSITRFIHVLNRRAKSLDRALVTMRPASPAGLSVRSVYRLFADTLSHAEEPGFIAAFANSDGSEICHLDLPSTAFPPSNVVGLLKHAAVPQACKEPTSDRPSSHPGLTASPDCGKAMGKATHLTVVDGRGVHDHDVWKSAIRIREKLEGTGIDSVP